MTEPTQPHGDEPKKKSLKLLLRSKPITEVETSIGRIYLYPLRVRDMTDFGSLEPAGVYSQVRNFLSSIGSLTVETDDAPERIPLDQEITKTLSDDEVEQIAEAYVQSSEWKKVRERAEDRKPVAREDGESASAYLIRLMQGEVEHQHQAAKQLQEKILGSSRGLFDQVRKSYTELGSTVKAFEAISRPTLEPSLSRGHLEISNHLAEHSARMARERAEELEMVRLTGKMTAESAKTLKDLAEAASALMEQFDERDRKADKSTRKQITIAVWSVGVSAVLALLALILSGLAYVQDRNNGLAGDQWQAKLLTVVEQGNKQLSAVERENEALRQHVHSLAARISELEATQRSSTQSEPPQIGSNQSPGPIK